MTEGALPGAEAMGPELSPDCLDAFPEPLLVVSRSGRLDAVNRPAARLLHLPTDGPPCVTLREIADLSAAELEGLMARCLATGAPVPLPLTVCPSGGRPLSLDCEGWSCLFAGAPAALLRVREDATSARRSAGRLRATLAQLYDMNSIRDYMLAQVSHDLRTPLNAILGMTEFMQTQPFGPLAGRYVQYVEDIHASGSILLQLVDQVMHLASADVQESEEATETLADLNECLENCRRVVEPIARQRGLEVVVPRGGRMPRLRMDQLLLKQILLSLLGTAARSTGRGGHVEVTVQWREDHAFAIQVEDDGPGIPADKLAEINSGLLMPSAYVTEDAQAGFGLALSRRTAKAIGGRLDIRSAVGRGTIASLLLPPHLVETNPAALH